MSREFSYDDYMLRRAMQGIVDDEIAALPGEDELADIHVSDDFREKMAALVVRTGHRQNFMRAMKAVAAVFVGAVLVFSVAKMMENGTLYNGDKATGGEDGVTAGGTPTEEKDEAVDGATSGGTDGAAGSTDDADYGEATEEAVGGSEETAYLTYMETNPAEAAPFALCDIDGDGVSELLQHDEDVALRLYQYQDEKVTQIDMTKDGSFCIYPETNMVWTGYSRETGRGESWKQISPSGATEVAVKEWEQDPKTGKKTNYSYSVDGKKATKSEYKSAVKKLKKGTALKEDDFTWQPPQA
ncbi:MAG: hypothetical protein VZQ83_03590 [Eubacterium sp.]|nr:hypothetical protein [Eubacterium sp.]